MKQDDLITAVAAEAGTSKADAERVVKALGEVTQTALKAGDEVTLPSLGKFSVTAKPAREGRNPTHRRNPANCRPQSA